MSILEKTADSFDLVQDTLRSNSLILLIASILISVTITVPRFGPGIPMSVDTTSHLYRVLFYDYWLHRGVFPFWSPDWYGGAPAILLYPPLGYFFVIGVSMLGFDPVLSYKLVDAIFYWIAPVTIYYLSRELGFEAGESALGALLFSVVPEVVENYLFFDRFPTVLSVPISCIFLLFFHRALLRGNKLLNVLISTLTMSALLLTHHLSAFIAGIIAFIMVILSIGRNGVKSPILVLLSVAVGTVGLTAFWFMPFLFSLGRFPDNPFYNRNVTFPFLRFVYFSFDVTSFLLGIAQLVLAAIAIQSILGRTLRGTIQMNAAIFFPMLLAGMALFQVGELLNTIVMSNLGQLVIVLAFVFFLVQFAPRRARRILTEHNGILFAVLWFIVFLWIGLGYYALPILSLPLLRQIWTKTMDVYRVWLYLAIPMCMLAARGFVRTTAKMRTWKPLLSFAMIALAVTPISVGVALKANYAFNHSVNGVLPYSAANAEIPQQIINYFNQDPAQGRILGIYVPFWVYLLPNYVGKPIVDGWYPQTKLVNRLVEISDYRIDDLETASSNADRIATWASLISQSRQLDITWVMIGSADIASALMQGTGFIQQLSVPYGSQEILVYKASVPPSFVETVPNESLPKIESPNPDELVLTYSANSLASRIIIKEAYFPTWHATADGQTVKVEKDAATGYMLLQVPAGVHQVILYQETNSEIWNMLSILSMVVWLGFGIALVARARSKRLRR